MAYNQLIPISTDDLSVSQPQMQSNFLAIYNAFNLNHVAFNSTNPLQGKHSFVEMPNQSATPKVTIANEVGLYCNSSTLTSQPELFFIKQFGTTVPAPLNGVNGYEVTSSNYIAVNGWTRLPSGIMLMWGAATVPNNTTPVTLPISATIPNFFSVYQILLTSNSNNGAVPVTVSLGGVTPPTNAPGPVAPLSFIIQASSFPVTLKYLVIGV